MKIVISPAKTLDYTSPLPTSEFTKPAFSTQARKISKELKLKTPSDLAELMDISPKLAELNWQRNQKRTFTATAISEISRQAVYAFNGDVYHGLDAYTLPLDKVALLQERLRILSGLYGLLKPLDLIQPYRLEMGTHLKVDGHNNLYEIWRTPVTKALNSELKKGDLFVNLASKEYFSAVDTKLLKVPVITPEFLDYGNGKMRMVSFFAKRARGMMVRYIIDSAAETVDDLKGFNYDGYAFDARLSDEKSLVFTR